MTVAPDGATIAVGDSVQMAAMLTSPPGWGQTHQEWSVNDTTLAIAGISTGMVTGRKAGKVSVRVRFIREGGGEAQGIATINIR